MKFKNDLIKNIVDIANMLLTVRKASSSYPDTWSKIYNNTIKNYGMNSSHS